MRNVKEELKAVRAKHNLTQKETAEILGMPVRTLENWENGSRRPSEWLFNLVMEMLEIKLGGKDMRSVEELRNKMIDLELDSEIKLTEVTWVGDKLENCVGEVRPVTVEGVESFLVDGVAVATFKFEVDINEVRCSAEPTVEEVEEALDGDWMEFAEFLDAEVEDMHVIEMRLAVEGQKRYLVTQESKTGDEYNEVFETLDEANKYAENEFNRWCEADRKKNNLVVYEVKAKDLSRDSFLWADDVEEIDWTGYEAADVPGFAHYYK